jgi:plastocyanin
MHRRTLLGTLGTVSLTALAGCASDGGTTDTERATSTDSPTASDSSTATESATATATETEPETTTPTASPTDSPTPTAASTPTTTATPSSGATVAARGTSFDPVRVRVEPGSTVVWDNESTGSYTSHTVTSAQFHDVAESWSYDESFEGGESLSYTFEESGVYEYYCTIHGKASMCGVVLVGDATLDQKLPCES